MTKLKRTITLLVLLIFILSTCCEVFAVEASVTESATTVTEETTSSDSQTGEEEALPEESEVEAAEDPVDEPVEEPVITAVPVSGGILLNWTEISDAEGYYLFRRTSPDEEWTRFYKTSSATTLKVTNKKVVNGTQYEYSIQAYNDAGTSDYAASITEYWLQPPEITSSIYSGGGLFLQWVENTAADGYEIQYDDSRFFGDAATVTIAGSEATSQLISTGELSSCFVRIRAYVTLEDGTTVFSPWQLCNSTSTNSTAKISLLKFNNKTFELRSVAKGKVGQYDTMQGGCYGNGYGYFALYNRNKEKCRIVKIDLNTGKRVKKSKILNIAHGNDLTYNENTNQLIAVHNSLNGKMVSFIDPTTLKVIGTKTIELDESLPGLTESRRAAFAGIGALAYNSEHNQYVARIKNLADLLILDENLNPVRYVRLTKKDSQTYQGMDTVGDYVLVGQSYKGSNPYNIISVYDLDGNYISKITVKKGTELENVFHNGSTFYAGFYTSGYKTYYVTKYKIKKIKKKNGKIKKKKVKVKVKVKELYRNNYIYTLKKL